MFDQKNFIDLISGDEIVTNENVPTPGTRFAHYRCAGETSFRDWGWMLYETPSNHKHNAGTWTHGPCHICGNEMRIIEESGEEEHFG